MIYDIIEKIDTALKIEIAKAMKKDSKFKELYLSGDDYIDRIFWICTLFSKANCDTDIKLDNFHKYLKANFHTKSGGSWGFTWIEQLWGNPKLSSTLWDTHRFYEFIDNIEENEKEQLVQSINQIDDIHIENISEIPALLKEQYLALFEEVKEKSPKGNKRNIYSEPIDHSIDAEPTISQENKKTSNLLIATIIILVLVIIFLIIFFVAKNRPNPHVDDKILPNGGTTTFLNSTATTASTEITTISLTNTTSSNIKTSAVSSEAATISTTHPITKKSDSNGNKSDPPVIVVTVNVDNGSHNNTETHTESPQNNTRQEPPVTQEQTTTPPQIATLPISKPEIEISSTEAHRGDSDVCVSVNFENLMYKGSYESIHINFNALYDSTLIFKNCTVSPNNTEINGLTYDNGHISFNMHGNYCENDVTVNLFFDVPDDTPDGDYTIQMLEDASTITLYTNDWFNPRVLLSLDRMGQIHVS